MLQSEWDGTCLKQSMTVRPFKIGECTILTLTNFVPEITLFQISSDGYPILLSAGHLNCVQC